MQHTTVYKMFGLVRHPFTKLPKYPFLRHVSYIQGQEPEPKIREYFYYVDHHGMLFLDDSKMKNFTSCFKDKQFLEFFFKRLRRNTSGRYEESFPFISLCGRERNFIRCDDLPIVFTHLLNDGQQLSYGYTGDKLVFPFTPEHLYMSPNTGRVYHPAEQKYEGIALIRSKLAIELSKGFEFEAGEDHPPTHFLWKGDRITLKPDWLDGVNIESFSDKIK